MFYTTFDGGKSIRRASGRGMDPLEKFFKAY
jgi:hypothetical protein